MSELTLGSAPNEGMKKDPLTDWLTVIVLPTYLPTTRSLSLSLLIDWLIFFPSYLEEKNSPKVPPPEISIKMENSTYFWGWITKWRKSQENLELNWIENWSHFEKNQNARPLHYCSKPRQTSAWTQKDPKYPARFPILSSRTWNPNTIPMPV